MNSIDLYIGSKMLLLTTYNNYNKIKNLKYIPLR